ncbi:MAG: twin-arginine translocase subunit TatC [Lentisphaerae bacterium]|nr:twin-arginine translocase subunit TatC [Lentisphaerota bacterium]
MSFKNSENNGSAKPFLAHLDDLRRAILWCAVAICAGIAVAVPLAPMVLRWLKMPLRAAGRDPDQFLQVIHVTGGFAVAMKLVFWTGVLLATPAILAAIGSFVFPGLTAREKKAAISSLAFGSVLFIAGVSMGYFVTMPIAIELMLRINNAMQIECAFIDIGNYVSFVLRLLIAFGLVFEMPVIVVALGSVGIVRWQWLRDKRRHMIVLIMIVSMLLTPPDPFTMILMSVPLIALYEVCIWIVWASTHGRARNEDADGS